MAGVVWMGTSTEIRNLIAETGLTLPQSANQIEPLATPITEQPPTNLSIPKLSLDLPISAAVIKNGQWQVYDDKVAWLATSSVPRKGNVILYAHNTQKLFGNLKDLKIGDTITVQQNGIESNYSVTKIQTIKANDVEAIVSENNQLTLYTCEGIFDQKRLVVYATPI